MVAVLVVAAVAAVAAVVIIILIVAVVVVVVLVVVVIVTVVYCLNDKSFRHDTFLDVNIIVFSICSLSFLSYSDTLKSFTSIPTFYIADYIQHSLYLWRLVTSPVKLKISVYRDLMNCNLAEIYQRFFFEGVDGVSLLTPSSRQKMKTAGISEALEIFRQNLLRQIPKDSIIDILYHVYCISIQGHSYTLDVTTLELPSCWNVIVR